MDQINLAVGNKKKNVLAKARAARRKMGDRRSIKHVIRGRRGDVSVRLTRSSAVKRFCQECIGWTRDEVRLCSDSKCPLYPFRLGSISSSMENVGNDD